MNEEMQLEVGRKLAQEVYAKVVSMTTPDEVSGLLAATAVWLLVSRVLTERFRHGADVEEVTQDTTCQVHDAVSFQTANSLREKGGVLFLAHHAPDLLTTPFEGSALMQETANAAFNKDGAEGVVRVLRRFGLHNWATRVRRSAGL